MWLVFDIGNSWIKGGVFIEDRLERTFVLPHDAASLAAGLDAEMDGLKGARPPVGLASVVPASTEQVAGLLRSRDLEVTLIDSAMRLPFEMAYRTPRTLGTDRLAAAAAAWMLYGKTLRRNVVALDAGTAFTYDVVGRDGVYLGGSIAPGPALMQRALHADTAQLPEVPLELPGSPIGRSTREAIQAGVMYGFIDSVRGLLERIRAALDDDVFVVATGGWSRLLHAHVSAVDEVDPHLVLRGVRILMTMNR